jgi:outer membrane protein assembly factor BamD (BamD/ComL family)
MMELEASRHSKTASTSPNVTVNQMSSRVCSVKTHFIYQKIMYHCDQYMKLFPQRTNRDIITYMNCKENNVTNFKC